MAVLFLKWRAWFARRPAGAAATGGGFRPAAETVLKSAVPGRTRSGTRQGMSVYGGRVATAAVKPWGRGVGAAGLIGGALAVRGESGVGAGPLLLA